MKQDDISSNIFAKKIAIRCKARVLVIQALYSWQLSGNNSNEIENQFRMEHDFSNIDGAYFKELLNGVLNTKSELDSIFLSFIERPLSSVDQVELAILRLCTYELRNKKDIPYKVVINEGIELTKAFGATGSYKFINGVLDKVASILRKKE